MFPNVNASNSRPDRHKPRSTQRATVEHVIVLVQSLDGDVDVVCHP